MNEVSDPPKLLNNRKNNQGILYQDILDLMEEFIEIKKKDELINRFTEYCDDKPEGRF